MKPLFGCFRTMDLCLKCDVTVSILPIEHLSYLPSTKPFPGKVNGSLAVSGEETQEPMGISLPLSELGPVSPLR